jgi:hypothetical protein
MDVALTKPLASAAVPSVRGLPSRSRELANVLDCCDTAGSQTRRNRHAPGADVAGVMKEANICSETILRDGGVLSSQPIPASGRLGIHMGLLRPLLGTAPRMTRGSSLQLSLLRQPS